MGIEHATTALTLMTRVRLVTVAIAVLATPALAIDTTPATRALESVRKAWVDELDELTASVRALAIADDTYEFVARPNIPYVRERFTPERLVAERIDTVLIINGNGNPLFWRFVNDRQNRGFADADVFLSELPSLSAPSAPGEPGLAGAARLARGPSLVVAMPIYPASRKGPARGWLIAARALDAAQWRRYAERAHVDVEALDPRTSEWPADAMHVPGKPPVPVLRAEPNGIRGWLPVYDVKGQPLQLLSVAVAKGAAPVEPIAPPRTRGLSVWLGSAALLAALVGALLLIVRRRRGTARSDPSAPRPIVTISRPIAAPPASAPAPASSAPDGVPPSTTDVSGVPTLDEFSAPDLEAIFDSGELAFSTPATGMEQCLAGSAETQATAAPAAAVNSANWRQGRLRERLATAEWVLQYQPQIDIHSDRIEGVEALLCIAEGGKERRATEILAEAQAAGLELEVTERWIRDACRERHAWSREVDCEFPVSVPVPQHALEDAAFLSSLRRILDDCELTPRHLELQVPGAALTNSAVALRALQEARRAGVLICIDGLGKGSSSLRSLTVVQIAKVRIDPALIREATQNSTASALVRAIIGAAGALGIAVCATGVDSAEQAATLAAHGRLLAQGVALGAPMESERFLASLRRRDVDTAKLPILQLADSARNEPAGTGSPHRSARER